MRAKVPLMFHWYSPTNPLPTRLLKIKTPVKGPCLALECPPWIHTGSPREPFDFSRFLRKLCADITTQCPELSHIDNNRLLFAITRARKRSRHGLQARVTPLRFPGGFLRQRRGRTVYQIQRYFHENTEFLYLVTFCLPRFLDQDFDDKLITIFHELYHISPDFNGDLRRHKGRYTLHSHSKKGYDQHMAELARDYLAQNPDPALFQFLRLNSLQLQHRHRHIQGIVVPHPKIVPVSHISH